MIKNIILDVGGILVDDSKQKFVSILNKDFAKVSSICDIVFGKSFKTCLLGEKTLKEHIESFKEHPEYETIKYIADPLYYNTTLPIIKSTIEYLYKLKEKGYNLYILSNFTDGGYEYLKNAIDINEIFTGCVFSFQEHVKKPGLEIFEILVNRYNLNKDECIFFDDVDRNINAGNEFGIKSIKYNSLNDIIDNI